MSRYHKETGNLEKAENCIKKAIKAFTVIFGSSSLDPSQAVAYRILGEIYMESGRYDSAKEQFVLAENIFKNLYKENFYKMNEVSVLLADLAILEKETGDDVLASSYLQKLTEPFSTDNENVKRVKEFFE